MELRIDRRIYSDECVSKAVYSIAKAYAVNRRVADDNTEILTITPTVQENDRHTEEVFLSALNDYKLRQIIEDETHDIRTILYAKAFLDLEDMDENDV